jgi:hypothetical protein
MCYPNPMKTALLVLAAAPFLLLAQTNSLPDSTRLRAMTARYAPVDISADLSGLPPGDRQALARLIDAGRVMDAIFLRQVWAGNETALLNLLRDSSPPGVERLHYFLINKGPWSRLDHDAPFVPGVPAKPEGGGFYPADASRQELQSWMQGLPEAERARANGFFTVIRRTPGNRGGFTAVPYSVEYQGELTIAAGLLREAAALTGDATLKNFLSRRADAFLTDDYYSSDVAWMELDSRIEPTIGPYEVYEDGLFNAKAAFEAFITVKDQAETDKLQKLSAHLQDIENHLPIDPKYRNPRLGALAPIRVVNEILAAGDGNRGVQTAAYNLPNDERVVREKGSKRVMLKNVQEAKFKIVLVPISRLLLAGADQQDVTFDAFFTHIVMHELMHGLGPHQIQTGGRATTVRQELKETYSTIEEAKADVSGLFALQYLIDKGVLGKELEKTIYDTFLASAFRSIRFGVNEAHGRGIAVQLNYLLDFGGFRAESDGTFSVNTARIKEGVAALTHEIMTLEADGNYAGVQDLLKRLGVVRPEIGKALKKLDSIPTDIEPRFTTSSF